MENFATGNHGTTFAGARRCLLERKPVHGG
jgi:hypothetical protein